MSDRTPTDYALEHAEYMATAAERLLDAINAEGALQLRQDVDGDVSDDEFSEANWERGESMSALSNRIYEFRKRRDSAAAAPTVATRQKLTQTHIDLIAERWVASHGTTYELVEAIETALHGTVATREPLTSAVINAAREAMEDSTEETNDGDLFNIVLRSHHAAALSLALDEYDRAHGIAARGTSTASTGDNQQGAEKP